MTQKEERAPAPRNLPLAWAQGRPRDTHAGVNEAMRRLREGTKGERGAPFSPVPRGARWSRSVAARLRKHPPPACPWGPGRFLPQNPSQSYARTFKPLET